MKPEDPTASPVAALPPPGRAARIGRWALGLGLAAAVLWAALAPLDEGVPAPAQVALDTKRKPVQHLSGGLVQRVRATEGAWVREGDVLVELDPATARASHAVLSQRYLGLRAVQGRLQAEQISQSAVSWHPDLLAAKADPQVVVLMRGQLDLLQARRAALRAELAAMEDSARGQQALIESFTAMQVSRTAQLALVQQELEQTRPLAQEGYVPRNRLFELERQIAEGRSALADLRGQALRAQQSIAELRQRGLQRQQEFRREVETELASTTREAQADAERLVAMNLDLQRTQIRAPASGQVVGLVVQAPGAVIQPGQKLMDIVPADEALTLEARIDPHLIDRIHPGLATDVRFSAFALAPQLVVQGEVASVSGDLLTDPQSNASYYLARVRLTPEGTKALGPHRLQAGMAAEVMVRTGSRSLLMYWLHPLTRRLAASLKEA